VPPSRQQQVIVVQDGKADPTQAYERMAMFNPDGSPFVGGGGGGSGLQYALVGSSAAVDLENSSVETELPLADNWVSYTLNLPESFTPGDLAMESTPGLWVASLTVTPWWPEENPPVSGQLAAALVYQDGENENTSYDIVRITFGTSPDFGPAQLVTPGFALTQFIIFGVQDVPDGTIRLRVYQNAWPEGYPLASLAVDFALVKLA
jgi:hypothetical protein